ncbi:MAG: MucR family transcriptional regulator [Pseudomonadota bacterium]
MDVYMKGALEIVKAQAQIRAMTEDELTAMVGKVYTAIAQLSGPAAVVADEEGAEAPIACVCEEAIPEVRDGRSSIKERYITCLECGKKCKFITRKHLAMHGLDPATYRAKWGLKSNQALVCKGLQRDRRKKMQDMKLWEKKNKPTE